ncbi:MAG: hypothetical protein VX642_05815 [Bdellovibrionota bacterium]|nr:hypothetical protein [Bdellovibrionota bacterium]
MNQFIFSCKDVSFQVCNRASLGLLTRFRLFLHSLVCGPCRNYIVQIEQLDSSMKDLISSRQNSLEQTNLDELTKRIINKHGN